MSSNPPPWQPPVPPPPEPPTDQHDPTRPYQEAAEAQPQQRRQQNSLMSWLITVALVVFGWFKYAFLLIKAVPALATVVTLFISFGLYTAAFGSAYAAGGLVIMILLHELGHVFEIRRQGMKATAPIFIPFLGAAIFQRQHATDPIKQAQIGIAGPIAGTIAATAAYVLYGATNQSFFLFWAWIGFYINLFNLIPFGMLDGGWILAPVSKWLQVVGLALLGASVIFFGFSPIVILLVILGIPTLWNRFRNPALDAYYGSVPTAARYGMGLAWLALVVYLGFASYEAHKLLATIVIR